MPDIHPLPRLRSVTQMVVGDRRRDDLHEDEYELLVVLAGTYRSRSGGREFEIGTGAGILYPAGCSHLVFPAVEERPSVVIVRWEEGREQPAQGARPVSAGLGRLLCVATWLMDLWPPADAEQERVTDGLFVALRSLALGGKGAGGGIGLRERIDHFLDHELQNRLQVHDLAALVGMEPAAFARRFREETGTTPHRHLVDRRVTRAIELISSTALPIKRIASMVGFPRADRLAAHVRRRTGSSPLALRRRIRSHGQAQTST